jgi:hypothetical protein
MCALLPVRDVAFVQSVSACTLTRGNVAEAAGDAGAMAAVIYRDSTSAVLGAPDEEAGESRGATARTSSHPPIFRGDARPAVLCG